MSDTEPLEKYGPHPWWATHAMRGFSTYAECLDHAIANSPGRDFGIRLVSDGIYEWFYPLTPRITGGAAVRMHQPC
jgi:hypothetical protein